MDVFDLQVKFGFDASEFNNGMKKAKEETKSFSEKLSSAGSFLQKGFSAAAKVGAAAIGGASTAITAFGKTAIDAGKSFDSSMAQVAATMGKTVDEIGDLRDFAQEMGSTTAFSASQAADALNYMALAGYDSEKSMRMLPSVLNLAAAGSMELATASDMVTDASSALGLTEADTVKMIDQMAVASSKTNTSVAQLGEAILTVGGTAKNLRGGTQELTQVLGLMADNGIKASESGTHLRNIMLAMTPQTDEAAEAMKKLGMNAYDDSGKLKSMSEIFGDLKSAMADMTDQEKTNTLSAIFNKTDLAAVNALLATDAERWTEVSEAIGNSTDAASKMADTQLDNLSGDITLFKSALEGAQIAVSDGLTPTLREFVQFGTDGLSELTKAFKEGGIDGAFEKFSELLSEGLEKIVNLTPKVIKVATKLLGSIGNALVDNADLILSSTRDLLFEVIMGIGEGSGLGEGLKSLIGSLTKYLPQLSEFLSILGVQIVTGIADGMAADPDAILGALSKIFESSINAWSTLLPVIMQMGFNLVMSLGEAILNNFPALVDTAIEGLSEFAEYLSQNAPVMASKLADLIGKIAEMLTDPDTISALVDVAVVLITTLSESLIATLPVFLEYAPQIIENLVQAVMDNFPKILDLGWDIVTELANAILVNMPQIVETAGKIIDNIGLGITSMVLSLNEKAKVINETIEGKIKEAFEEYKKIAKDLIQKMIDGFEEMRTELVKKAAVLMTSVITKVNEKIDEFKKGFTALVDEAKTWGKDLIHNFIDGITDKWAALKEKVSGVAQTVKDFLGFSEPKEGPLSNFHTYAPDMMDLYAKGIKENTNKVTSQLEESLTEVKGAFNGEPTGSNSTGLGGGVNNFYFTFETGTISSDYDAYRAAQIMSEQLSSLKSMQTMAVGG